MVVTAGPLQPRLKPGIAIAIVRDMLAALGALHRARIVHGDVKPSNVMLKRTGNAKVVDIGSAYCVDNPPPQTTCTPAYAAPEVLGKCTPQSDCRLGYVLVEMLTGRPPFLGKARFTTCCRPNVPCPATACILPQEVARAADGLLPPACRARPGRRFSSQRGRLMSRCGHSAAVGQR